VRVFEDKWTPSTGGKFTACPGSVITSGQSMYWSEAGRLNSRLTPGLQTITSSFGRGHRGLTLLTYHQPQTLSTFLPEAGTQSIGSPRHATSTRGRRARSSLPFLEAGALPR